jgi:hypothetical protein
VGGVKGRIEAMGNFKFEPQATAEAIRLLMAALIIFGVLPWTPEQEVAAFATVSGIMTWITRSFSIPVQTVIDAGSSVTKLKSAAEDREARESGQKPPLPPSAIAFMLAAVMTLSACGGNDKPNLTPAGQVADNASEVIDAADLALTAIDALTPTVLPRQTTVNIANVFIAIGKGGVTLADALAAYKKNVTPESWRTLQTALVSINGLVADAIALAPEGPARERVKAIAAPILAALFAVTLPPPPMPSPPSDEASWSHWQEQRMQRLIVAETITQ